MNKIVLPYLMSKTLPTVEKFPAFNESFLKNIGPSLVTLGLGIGGGEYILWPYLASQYGFGILWGALLGITFQLFIILEVARYTAVRGESIVHGLARIHKAFPYWLILSTLVGFGWPGFAATAATLIINLLGLPRDYYSSIAILILLVCGSILLFGKGVYKRIEFLQKIIVPGSFLILLFLFVQYLNGTNLVLALQGILGIGEGYNFLPAGLNFAVFLGAFAYAGSGGNFLLGQSFYVIERGHGHTKFAEKFDVHVANIKDETVKESYQFTSAEDPESIQNFKNLRRFQWQEGIFVFWGLGFLTIFILTFLARSILGNIGHAPEGVGFLLRESSAITTNNGALLGILFLLIGTFALFSVQLGALDIMGRFTALAMQVRRRIGEEKVSIGTIYKRAVAVQLSFGVLLFLVGFSEPLALVVTGAVLNAFAMAVIAFSLVVLNTRFLPRSYRPSVIIKGVLFSAGSIYTILFLVNLLNILK